MRRPRAGRGRRELPHPLAEVLASRHAVVGAVLDVRDGHDIRDESQPTHSFDSLLAVRTEVERPTVGAQHDVADAASVAQCDRQSLADDRVVVARRIADQDDPVGVGRARPGVITRVGGTGPGRRGGGHRR